MKLPDKSQFVYKKSKRDDDMKSYTLTGVKFYAMSKKDIVRRLTELCRDGRGAKVFTPNSVILHKASKDDRLISLLGEASLLIPDGAGLSLACRICGYPCGERLAGIDAAYQLLRYAERHSLSVYLLGGELGVAHEAALRLKSSLPHLKVCGTHHGYFDKQTDSAENQAVISSIRRAAPDIVFVCLGFPCQEKWIQDNSSSLPSVRLFMGLGGSLDVWSGSIRRAPVILQRVGLEWLWRCILQPRRVRDIISIPLFLIDSVRKR
jgi:N-acetylglucosaminyldiphosphoundecaprenol N-acetyl-beta-D-mannosaminyltransferase